MNNYQTIYRFGSQTQLTIMHKKNVNIKLIIVL